MAGFVRLGLPCVRDALTLELWQQIALYDEPVLICHGTRDHIVPFSCAERAAGCTRRFLSARHRSG